MSRLYDETATPSFADRPTSTGIAAMIEERVVKPLVAWSRRRATYRELSALDDRQLADIGLSRSDIEYRASSRDRLLSSRG